MKNLKILNYAVNGLGLGHLSRLISINRWISRITGALGINTEILFITSSECDTLAYQNGFASFKIPSKNIIGESNFSSIQYKKIAKQWIWNAINLCSPDIFIVDTFPYGSFHELPGILDFGFKKIFIYRAIKKEIAIKPIFQKTLLFYDKIIIPVENSKDSFIFPESMNERINYTNEIVLKDRDELHSRDYSRELLGLKKDKLACYVTAGGGGDPEIESTFHFFAETLKDQKEIEFIFGAGPLYRGKEFHYDNIRWISRYNIIDYFNAFDFAISAGGYNSVYELLYCGIPTIFYHQERLYDDQQTRILNLAENNICMVLNSFEKSEILQKVSLLKDDSTRMIFSNNAKINFNKNHAFEAAKIILSDSIDPDAIERIRDFIPPNYFYSLKESNISEKIGLKSIYFLDYNYHLASRQMKVASIVSDFFDFPDSIGNGLSNFTKQIYSDFIDYPLNHISLGYLRYLKNKNVNLDQGIKFLSVYLKINNTVQKSIQDQILDITTLIQQWENAHKSLNDKISEYIIENTNKRNIV